MHIQVKKISLLLLFLWSINLLAQNNQQAITIEKILSLKSVSDVQISPDGKWVAYTVSENDLKKDKGLRRVYKIPITGGEPIAVTSKEYSASQPRWSTDNKYLSFLASKGDDEKTQVWLSNRLGGDSEVLTKIPQGVNEHEWSPTENKLLLVLTDPKPEELTADKEDDKKVKPYVIDRRQFKQDYVGYLDRYRNHIYTLIPGDSLARQLTFGDFDDSDPVWSPDGKKIAFVSNRTEDPDSNADTNIWVVSVSDSAEKQPLVQVTTNPNKDDSPTWSLDGKSIAYKTVLNGKLLWYAGEKLAISPSVGGQASVLTESLDRNISMPKFSKDGKSILFLLEENGASVLASVDPKGKNLKRVISGNISVANYALHGETIIPLLGKVDRPNNLYIFEKNELKELTTVNDELLATTKKPIIEKINFKSTDGTPIDGFVVKPIDFDASKKYPTILWIHGGPTAQYDFSFDTEPQLFAANGYVVLLINPRGSTGYGEDFCKAIFADWGNLDYQDVMSAIDYAIAEGYADPNLLTVGGWSYGGILTNYVITKTNRFKAAMSGASEALYRANYGHDHYQLTWEQELGLPWENKEAWERISPYNDVAKIVTPTLWMGGSDDWNVPILNSEQMYMAMKRLGRETQLIVYPGEHHGIRRPSFQKDRLERYLAWMKKYVK
ncbi:MAG: S9 family peptidase [Cellulophaga sp.]|nr:S9 family peptidase [Cellulophaga sp.]